MNSKLIKLVSLCTVLFFVMTAPTLKVFAENVYYPFTQIPDYEKMDTIDIYKHYEFLWWEWDEYVGQLHYHLIIKWIPDGRSDCDFYAFYMLINLNPGVNIGKSNWYIKSGYFKFDLLDSHQVIIDRLPDRTSGSYTISYGWGVSLETYTFTVTRSYTLPDVDIDPDTDFNWGGYVKWSFSMTTIDAEADENTFRFTAIIRTQSGFSVNARVTIYTYWVYRYPWNIEKIGDSHEYTVTFDVWIPNPSGGGIGGCPWLLVWNGTNFELENNLLPPPNWVKYDVYRIENNICFVNNILLLKIAELGNETSYIDSVKVYATIHPSTVKIAVNQMKNITTYIMPIQPIVAIDENGNNVLPYIVAPNDKLYIEKDKGGYIILNFGNVYSEYARLVIRADYLVKGYSLSVYVLVNGQDWHYIATVTPRHRWYTEVIDLSEILDLISGNLIIKIEFTKFHKIDYVGLEILPPVDIRKVAVELINATLNNQISVTEIISDTDENYIILNHGDEVLLYFEVPDFIKTLYERGCVDFIMIIHGYYVTATS